MTSIPATLAHVRLRPALAALAGTLALMALSGCHDDMWFQPKVHKPYQESDFFADGQTARPAVPGTVAREAYFTDNELHTGFGPGKKLLTEFPFAITRADLNRGQERFDIYCSPCHGALGYGDGMIARRGFSLRRTPGNYHTEKLRKAPAGHFFDVITHGFGTMYSYSQRIQDPKDRWRIVAYIRALQLSQNATPADVPPNILEQLSQPVTAPGARPISSISHGGAE